MSFSAAGPRRHRFTVSDYYRMGEIGILGEDNRVELIEGEIIDRSPPAPEPCRHLLTVADYYAMRWARILTLDPPAEIVDGEIVDKGPVDNRHAATVAMLANLLRKAADGLDIVCTNSPITLDAYSELIPSLALLRPPAKNVETDSASARVLLIIEVGDAELAFERDIKVPLYACCKVPEVWIVDLRERRFTRYRGPQQRAYAHIDQPDLSVALAIAAISDVNVDLSTLFTR